MDWYEATNAHFQTGDYYKRRKLGGLLGTMTKSVRSILQSPNILLDGWEGMKAYTFEKKQSKSAHFEKNFRGASRAVQHDLYTSNLLPTPM